MNMNTTCDHGWNANINLDALANAAVIAAGIVVFLLAVATALYSLAPEGVQETINPQTYRTGGSLAGKVPAKRGDQVTKGAHFRY